MNNEIDPAQEGSGHNLEEAPFTAEDRAELQARLAADKLATEDRTELEDGEVIRYTPEITRLDESTGEPVIPLLFVRGMGAAEALPWYVKELAQADERPVISVAYHGRLEGSAKLAKIPDLEGAASEIDLKQAENIATALGVLGISKVDMIAESRGAIRGLLAMRDHPELFRNVELEHPAGQDAHNYLQTHVDAAREKVARAARGSNEVPDGLDATGRPSFMTRLRNSRKEQKSVAHARLDRELAKVDPNIRVIVTGDPDDKAIRSSGLQDSVRSAQNAGANVEFVETNWGGHGFQYSLDALNESIGRLRRMERERAQG